MQNHFATCYKYWVKCGAQSFIQFISHVCSKYAYIFCCSREKVNTLSLKHLIRCAKSCAVQNIPQIFHMLCHFTSHSPHHKYYSFLTLLFSISFLCISFLFLWICCSFTCTDSIRIRLVQAQNCYRLHTECL